jgi:hypothetical protein
MARNWQRRISGCASNSRMPRHPNEGLASSGSGKYGSSLSLPISKTPDNHFVRLQVLRRCTLHLVLLVLRGKMILDEEDKFGPIEAKRDWVDFRRTYQSTEMAVTAPAVD